MPRVVVVGAGAIGGALGGLLHAARYDVLLVARGAHGQALIDAGLLLRTPRGQQRLQVPTVRSLDEVEWRADDVVGVATKLYDAEPLYRSLQSSLPRTATLVVLQNGMAADAWVQGWERVVHTVVWLPAELLVPGRIDLHGDPHPGWIDVDPRGATLAQRLRDAGLGSTVRPDLDRWRRAKWCTNLCGAALLWGHADWVPGLLAEGRAVFAAAGLEVASEDEVEQAYGTLGLAPIEGAERHVGGSTGQSHSRGKPLEVPWLNGPLVALAELHGVDVPLNRRVLALERG